MSSMLPYEILRSILIMFLIAGNGVTQAFIKESISSRPPCHGSCSSATCRQMPSASDLLYQDQQEAMLRRALQEEELLTSEKKAKPLEAAKLKAGPTKAGTGFGSKNASAMSKEARLGAEQAKVMKRDGVLRINNALSPSVTQKLRQHLLEQQALVEKETERDSGASKLYYGVEQARKNRCDMHLSLSRGGVRGGNGLEGGKEDRGHVLADALGELLGTGGTLRPIYEALVTKEGEFYELAGIITNPGSNRQMIHPDLPFQKDGPLYVIFLALQDVTEEMGPTSFLLKSHTEKAINVFESGDMEAKDDQLRKADCRLATISAGDAVLFDARILHCGGGNDSDAGATRVMLNFSFRNPKVQGDLGYKGSMMPGYVGAMTLGDVTDALDMYKAGDADPFAKYGNGIDSPVRP
eukprot:scaffold7542_cov113-Cylindrotheca_fusiformis.AAC.4